MSVSWSAIAKKHISEAKEKGLDTRPVLLGPVSYLLGKARDGDFGPLTLLPRLLPIYAEVLRRSRGRGSLGAAR